MSAPQVPAWHSAAPTSAPLPIPPQASMPAQQLAAAAHTGASFPVPAAPVQPAGSSVTVGDTVPAMVHTSA